MPKSPHSSHTTKSLADVAKFWNRSLDEAALQCDGLMLHHVTLDSRVVGLGDVFVALQGQHTHGLEYLKTVSAQQPGLVITDRALTDEEREWLESTPQSLGESLSEPIEERLEVWVIEDLVSRLGEFADWFYDHPSQHINVVGITGTNGKTSTAFYTAQLLQAMGETVALMGTLGNGLLGRLQPTANTTPDAISVHRLLAEFVAQGAGWAIMEVSSHALVLHRVKAVRFNTVALTQVTRDHLDFHQTEAAYQSAKKRLFTDYITQHQVINADDPLGQTLLNGALAKPLVDSLGVPLTVLTYSTHSATTADLLCTDCVLSPQGLQVTLRLKGQASTAINIPLLGAFNLQNVMCALAILVANGFDWTRLLELVPTLTPVLGRMQRLAQQPLVLVDFAHTPDALQQLLHAVQGHLGEVDDGHERPKLWLVFGCGGDRDAGKRPLMAKIAEETADNVLLTNDNPRFEAPEAIIADIRQGFSQLNNVLVELNRQVAIETVLQLANLNDIVVIAGKGHEAYQDVKGVKSPFSDQQVVLDWLARRHNGE